MLTFKMLGHVNFGGVADDVAVAAVVVVVVVFVVA